MHNHNGVILATFDNRNWSLLNFSGFTSLKAAILFGCGAITSKGTEWERNEMALGGAKDEMVSL